MTVFNEEGLGLNNMICCWVITLGTLYSVLWNSSPLKLKRNCACQRFMDCCGLCQRGKQKTLYSESIKGFTWYFSLSKEEVSPSASGWWPCRENEEVCKKLHIETGQRGGTGLRGESGRNWVFISLLTITLLQFIRIIVYSINWQSSDLHTKSPWWGDIWPVINRALRWGEKQLYGLWCSYWKCVSRLIINGIWFETLWNTLGVKPKKLQCKHKVLNILSQSAQALN